MVKVIVLMSTYNGEKYLKEQIESILRQTEYDIRLCIHDDGSIDRTVEIIKEYTSLDNRVFFMGSKHKGYPNCFFDMVFDSDDAEYYAFSDQDDVWDEKKIEKAIMQLEDKSEPTLYACNKEIVDKDLNTVRWGEYTAPKRLGDVLLKYNNISGCTMVFNYAFKQLFMRHMPKYAPYHDAYLLRLAYLLGIFIYDENKYMKYRQHENNVIGAEYIGGRLVFEKLKRLDFSLNKYRNTNIKLYAKDIYDGYRDLLSASTEGLIHNIMNASNFKNRVNLLTNCRVSFSPISLYVVIKMRIILGLI
ncbi:MAG: glycosyltransferase [Selenomonas ruminantium]|jgi:rhamnosyltransferase|nr:glycosyltransferase [Selenomonas ruminantium]